MLDKPSIKENAGKVAVVIGANSRIAVSLIQRLVNDESFTQLIAVSRQFSDNHATALSNKVSRFQCDYT